MGRINGADFVSMFHSMGYMTAMTPGNDDLRLKVLEEYSSDRLVEFIFSNQSGKYRPDFGEGAKEAFKLHGNVTQFVGTNEEEIVFIFFSLLEVRMNKPFRRDL